MKHNFIGKSKYLNEFFLKSGKHEMVNLEWAYLNKEILRNHFRRAFEYFWADEAQQEYDEADAELRDLQCSCGRE